LLEPSYFFPPGRNGFSLAANAVANDKDEAAAIKAATSVAFAIVIASFAPENRRRIAERT